MGSKPDIHADGEPSLLEYALDCAYEAIYLIDAQGQIVYANAAAARALGYSRDELQRMAATDIDAGLSAVQLADIEKMSKEAGGTQFETRHRRRDGTTFPVEIHSSGFDFHGQSIGVALAHDISERKATEEALRVSEERMRLFFERQLVGMAITSPEKGWLRVNRKMCDMLGYTAEELMQKTWAELTHPDDLAPDVAQFELMLKGAIDSYTVEKRYIRKDGGIVHAALSIGCVRRADGSMDYVLALVEDITGRKHMEDELRQREMEARTLIEHTPDTIARYDRNCRRTFVNQAFAATVPGGAAALLGKKPSESPGGPTAAVYEEKIAGVWETGSETDFELIWAGGGKEICSHIRLIPEFDAQGKIESVLAIGRDISERKRNEEELKRTKSLLRERNAELQAYKERLEVRVAEQTEALAVSTQQLHAEMDERRVFEERLSAVAENIPGFIFTVHVEPDGHTTFPFASPGVEHLFGVSLAELRKDAMALRARYHPDDLPRVLSLMAETQQTLKQFRIEIRIANRDGNYVWTEIRSQPRRLPDGATEWHGIMLDITARKQAELELEASRAQLRRTIAQREELRAEERKRMAREIHDELGQVLTGLRLQVSNLLRRCRASRSPFCEGLQEIDAMVGQAVGVAHNIAAVLRPVQADVGIVPALELQASRFSTVTGIRCACALPEETLALNELCTTAIYRIVQELLTNVARHAQASEVNISMRSDGADYVVRVRDNGQGFDPAAVGADSYGLAGIRERVLMLGGQLDINSRKEQGTEVVVRLPMEVCHG